VERHPHEGPHADVRRERLGERVVERAVDRRNVGLDAADADGQASAFAAAARSAAASVRSQVKSRSLRPKCPYAAVRWKIGRRRSSRSMIAAGRRSKNSWSSAGSFYGSISEVPKVSTIIDTGRATPIA
jgi:hypothetical protein